MNGFIRIIFILVSILLVSFRAEAQKTDSIRNTIENGWIQKMSSKMAVDLSFNNSFKTFTVASPSNNILLYPNTPNNLSLSANYEFISIRFVFAKLGDQTPQEQYANTSGNIKYMKLYRHFLGKLNR